MKRLRRILLNAATVVSLLLCVATAALWVDAACRPESSPRSFGVPVDVTFGRSAVVAHVGPYNFDGGLTWRVSYWKMILMTGLAPALWVGRRAFGSRRHVAAGLCPTCGYDLRATPERCPECGRVAP